MHLLLERITSFAFALTVVALAGNSTAQAAQAAPCREIAAACRQAGFVAGGARTGDGLMIDCVQPIVQGMPQRRRAGRPLPQVDSQLVAACKANNPNFGRPNAPADETDQPREPGNRTGPAELAPVPEPPAGTRRPNIVFILADDFSMDLLQYMPRVRKMQQDGVTLSNYFVTDSLCCPSRSSIFTGRYPHSTGIYRNVGQDGGYLGFVNRGLEDATLATSLAAAGYRTAMMGKYLNGYQPKRDNAAPGWNAWDVAGNGYPEFNYDLNENGMVTHYGRRPADYLTDVLSARAVAFIKQKSDAPFMIEVATFAPHAPYTPAPRDADAFPGLHAPRTPAFNAAPDADAPKWLASLPPLSPADMATIDTDYRKRAQSVLAIDAMIGALQAAVLEIGAAENTYFVFSSDNGYHMGEHRMMPGKMTAYDTDIRVPLIVTGPSVPAGRVIDEIAQNIDLCPTFEELGFAPASTKIDGRSLAPLLHGETIEGWRTMALIEHRGPVRNLIDPDLPSPRSGNPTTYEAMRTATTLYVEYADGEKEYHDLKSDPDELHNTFASLSDERKAALHAALDATQKCHGADCRSERVERSAMRN